MAAFPRYCAPQQDQSGSAADWRPPKSGDQKGDGRPDHPQGAGDPRTEDGGIRTERARREHLSRRSLWNSTNLQTGELSEALPPAQPLRRLWNSRLTLPRLFAPLMFAVSVVRLSRVHDQGIEILVANPLCGFTNPSFGSTNPLCKVKSKHPLLYRREKDRLTTNARKG